MSYINKHSTERSTQMIKINKVVSINYTLVDQDNHSILGFKKASNIVYIHGRHHLLPSLEDALFGKHVGDDFEVLLAAENAYGDYNPQYVQQLPISIFTSDKSLKVGMTFIAKSYLEHYFPVKIIAIEDDIEEDIVTVDANHPLAGKNLIFKGQILDIREPTHEEIIIGKC